MTGPRAGDEPRTPREPQGGQAGGPERQRGDRQALVQAFAEADRAFTAAMRQQNPGPAPPEHRAGRPDLAALDEARETAALALVPAVAGHHCIEERVGVWLVLTPDGWAVDAPTLDGAPLFGYDGGPVADECPCQDPVECRLVRVAAAQLTLPTAAELLTLLQQAMSAAAHCR